MSTLREIIYLLIHLFHVFYHWFYLLSILSSYNYLYPFFSPSTKAFLDLEYKIAQHDFYFMSLWERLRDICSFSPLLTHPDGSFRSLRSFISSEAFASESQKHTPRGRLDNFTFVRRERNDTPLSALLRITRYIYHLSTTSSPSSSSSIDIYILDEIQDFWRRGITGASKPSHFLFGGSWLLTSLPDPRLNLKNDPLLCAIAASTVEQMVEVFNWRIEKGIRRDLPMMRPLRGRKPYWDKDLKACERERVPGWCKDVGPVEVEVVVDSSGMSGESRDDVVRRMKESKAIGLSESFRRRNLLANEQFLYFA